MRELAIRQGWGKDGMNAEASTAFRLEDEGVGCIVVNFGTLIKDFHIHVMYARREFLAKNPDAMREFLKGWFETLDYMRGHRQETIAIASRAIDMPASTMGRVYDLLMPAFNTTGRFNPKALETLGRSFVETGGLPAMPDMQSLVTEKFLPGS